MPNILEQDNQSYKESNLLPISFEPELIERWGSKPGELVEWLVWNIVVYTDVAPELYYAKVGLLLGEYKFNGKEPAEFAKELYKLMDTFASTYGT